MAPYKSFLDLPSLAQPAGLTLAPPGALPAAPAMSLPNALPASAALPLGPTNADRRPAPTASQLEELTRAPAAEGELPRHLWKAAGTLLANTGDHGMAGRILELAKAPAGAAIQNPQSKIQNPPGPGLDVAALARPAPSRTLDPNRWGAGLRSAPGGTDAPDQRLREIALKSAQGQPLDAREIRRLAQRIGVESQPGAFGNGAGAPSPRMPGTPGGPALDIRALAAAPGPDNPRSIEALMAKAPGPRGPMLDSNRPADNAVDRLLRGQAASDESALRQQQIRNGQATEAERTQRTAQDAASAQAGAEQQARHSAFLQSGAPKTRSEAAKAGITDEGILAKYPTEAKSGPQLLTLDDPASGQKVQGIWDGNNFSRIPDSKTETSTQLAKLIAERDQFRQDGREEIAAQYDAVIKNYGLSTVQQLINEGIISKDDLVDGATKTGQSPTSSAAKTEGAPTNLPNIKPDEHAKLKPGDPFPWNGKILLKK